MSRRTWAVAILVAWAASLGWLARRQLFSPPEARLAEAGLHVEPGATYYRLNVAGEQVGFASSTIDTTVTGIRLMDLLVLRVSAAGGIRRTAALARGELTRALRLQSLDVRFDGEPGRFVAAGQLSGDTLLTLALASRSDAETTRVSLAHAMILPSMVPLRLALAGELKPGRTHTITVFDPVALAERRVTMTVQAETTFVVSDSAAYDSTARTWMPVRFDTVRAFRIAQTTGGSGATTVWIDREGRIVRVEAPSGFTMERQAFELAYQEFRERDTTRMAAASTASRPGAVVGATALMARVALPGPREARRSLRVRMVGARIDGLRLAGAHQRLAGDTLLVERAPASALTARYSLPARDSAGGESFAAFLRPEPLIQSGDRRILALARQIVGSERDPGRAARLIGDWVHEHLDRRGEATLPSAVHVLEQRRGDCNEHTLLYVTLARAVGLPARTAAGLLYLHGHFYYHAWPEVYLADWVPVDPTLGQFPADAAHLRFSTGALARQAELLPLIGALKLEVL